MKSPQSRIETYSRSLEFFACWLAVHRKADGSLTHTSPSCISYMPLPLYAHAVGDTKLLAQSLSIIEQRCHHDAEKFLRPPTGNLLAYRSAWMLVGATLGDRPHLAAWLERRSLRYLHQETGGMFGTEKARLAGSGEICLDSTTNACAAFCIAGNLTGAERLGGFLERLVQDQPEPERRFLCVWDTKRGLLAEFDPKQP